MAKGQCFLAVALIAEGIICLLSVSFRLYWLICNHYGAKTETLTVWEITIMAKISAVKVLFLVILLNLEVGKGSAELNGDKRQKRHLNWSTYTLKSSDTQNDPDLRINYYKPHEKCEKVNENEDYTAFTLYKGNTGYFHFVKEETALTNSGKCNNPNGRHAGAYYTIYNECPEHASDLVASGFCLRNQKLGFDSITFN